MRKITVSTLVFVLGFICFSFTTELHGVYVQLHPSSNKKIVLQIMPDKTYADVVAYVNFYSADNKRVAQQAFDLADSKEKYIRKGTCTTRVFKFSFDKPVTRVTIDHVNENDTADANDKISGKKLNIPMSTSPLGPIEK
jgi:hypothetical protein